MVALAVKNLVTCQAGRSELFVTLSVDEWTCDSGAVAVELSFLLRCIAETLLEPWWTDALVV